MTTPHDPSQIPDDPREPGPPPADELDHLLRLWHERNAEQAQNLRHRLMQAIARQDESDPTSSCLDTDGSSLDTDGPPAANPTPPTLASAPSRLHLVRRFLLNRYSPIAATLILAAVLVPLLMPPGTAPTYARNVILAPEGGRLDALDRDGHVMGPCPLRHTDVDVAISAFFCRVRVTQRFQNTYADKIEAVYTFPLSHRAAVDRMTMTIGDRVIMGEVHERQRARRMYEAAREQGYIASLLEQERPNIFTQSVANIEPGAEVTIDISYVEMLESKDGLYSFDFPMVVGPRYIPGSPTAGPAVTELPAGLKRRGGITLMAPATLTVGEAGDTSRLGALQPSRLDTLLRSAVPISAPDATWWSNPDRCGPGVSPAPSGGEPALWYRFEALYPNGSKERGTLHTDGTGQINGRWFYADPRTTAEPGTGFSPNTTRVPDAARITPVPVKPDKRAGHDVSLRVTIDTGGPGILAAKSELHEVVRTQSVKREDGHPRKLTLELMKADEIPNRDFILNWRQTADTIQEATFTHTDRNGKFLTLIVQPPDRVTDEQAVPRELIFVLDTSGSMSGLPIEKAKQVMSRAIDTLRPRDTFNLITFSGDTRILWDKPRPFNQANRDEAQAFLAARQGSGGTEMMKAINAALIQTASSAAEAITLEQLANLPADGRTVSVRLDWSQYASSMLSLPYKIEGDRSPISFALTNGAAIETHIPASGLQKGDARGLKTSVLTGKWQTRHGHAMLVVDQVDWIRPPTEGPVRICCFMTDGYVGNDMEIIDAIRRNAHTTRVFSFGIGNSVNRYLLDNMAKAGRGEVEYVQVTPGSEPQAKAGHRDDAVEQAIARFTRRIQTPVLIDVSLTFSDGIEVTERVPAQIPDLYDVRPLVLHGRYTRPGKGTLTIRGRSGSGPYQRVLDLDLPDAQPEHDTIATLWARARVESIMNQDLAAAQRGAFPEPLKNQIIDLGERFGIMTPFTSFVAVEKARITIGGQPRLVTVPIEMPQGVSYEGIFGPCIQGTASADALFEDCLGEIRFAAGATAQHQRRAARKESAQPAAPDKELTDVETLRRGIVLTTTPVPGQTAPPAPGLALTAKNKPARQSEGREDRNRAASLRSDYAHSFTMMGTTELTPAYSRRPQGQLNMQWGDASDSLDDVEDGGVSRSHYFSSLTAWNYNDGDGDGFSANFVDCGLSPGDIQLYCLYDPVQQQQAGMVSAKGKPAISNGPGAVQTWFQLTSNLEDKMELPQLQAAATPAAGSTPAVEGADRTPRPKVIPLHNAKRSEADAAIKTIVSSSGPATTQPAGPSEAAEMATLLTALSTDAGRAWATRTLLRERLALLVATLVKEGRIDEARKLADALAAFAPDFAGGLQMAKILADPSLAPSTRDRQIAALADEARKPIETAVRHAKVLRRLHPELQKIVKNPETKPADARISDASTELMVNVLATDTQPNTLAALKQAGLRVDAVAERAKLAVGRISPEKLEDVALLDVVRKIDPHKPQGL